MKRFHQFLVLPAVLLSCAWASTPGASRPNVILITIDTVRADHLACYGYKQIQTPVIDSLARDGVLFERAISQVPLTWPSHAAILTGTYPFQNGVQDFTGQPLAPQLRSIAQAFKQHGYSTGAVVSAFVLDRSWGLDRGFDFYDDAFSAETFAKKDIGLVDRRAAESVTHALRWLQKTPKRPFFLWLHLYDPHSPYDPPEPFGSQYRVHPYDGEIAYADHEIGRLIAWLKTNRLYDASVIALLSDHGESLGDHGEHEHGFFIYNSTVHIPLIVKPPAGRGFRADRVLRAVETTSLAPTLLSLARITDPISKQFHSSDLLDKEATDQDSAYSETLYTFSSFGWSPLHSLETSRYHYIDAPLPELYDIGADPQEKSNLASNQPATVAVLKGKLQAILLKNPFKLGGSVRAQMSPDTSEKLQALGYLSYRLPSSSKAPPVGLPDPKDKLSEFNTILAAGDALRAGDFVSGRNLLTQLEQRDARMYVVPFMLAETAAREQKWDEAATAFQRCLGLNPEFDQAMTGLAHALSELGNLDGAKNWLESALKHNPQNYRAWFELGSVQEKTDKKSAESAYAKAVSIQPNFALGWRALGVSELRRQNYVSAAKSLSKAVDLGLQDSKLFNFLGIAYSRTNRETKAIETYRRAIQLDPGLAEAHLNLAYSYERVRKTALASEEYREACQLRAEFCHVVKRDK